MKKAVDICVNILDDPAITTDVIVGFPGETEEEFENNVEFMKKIHFYEMHVFKYSRTTRHQAAQNERSDR